MPRPFKEKDKRSILDFCWQLGFGAVKAAVDG